MSKIPLNIEYVPHPLGGLRLDVPPTLMDRSFSAGMLNCKITRESIKQREGTSKYGSNLPLDDKLSNIRQFETYAGDVRTVALTYDDIYEYYDPEDEWDSILGGKDWNCSDTVFARTSFFNNKLILTDGTNRLLEWDGEASSVDTVDNASNYVARDLSPLQYRMIYGNLIEDENEVPQRVRWTKVGTYNNFDDGYANFVDLIDTPGEIMALEPLGDSLIIYKDDSIVVCSWIGGKNVFEFDTRVSHVGLVAQRGVVNLGNRHLFLGSDNVYEYTGGREVNPVGDAVASEMPGLVSSSYIDRSIATVFNEEAWFFVTIDGELPDTTYVYNWRQDQWYKYDIGATGIGTIVDTNIVTIGDLEGTIGGLGGRIGDFGSTGVREKLIIGDSDGYVYKIDATDNTDDGDTITQEWESKDLTFGEDQQTLYNRYHRVELEAKGDSVEVHYSTDGGNTWNLVDDITLDDDYSWYRAYFDASSRKLRIRFRNNNEGEEFSLRTFGVAYKEGASR